MMNSAHTKRHTTPGAASAAVPVRRRIASLLRAFAVVLTAGLLCACSNVDSEGSIPRSGIRIPRTAKRLTVIRKMTFEHSTTPATRNTVIIPEGEYIFEAEDDTYLYFRSPEPLEYRMYRKEGYADAWFQLGGLALARKSHWEDAEYPACTYTDGKKQDQKRLTCPLSVPYFLKGRGFDWESDFDAED